MKSERGAAAVEFALVLVPLVLLVFGIINFGWAFSVWTEMAGGVREGARVMAVTGDAANAKSRTVDMVVTAKLTSADVHVYVDGVEGAACAPNKRVTVTAKYPMPVPVAFPPFPNTWQINRTGAMPCGG